VSSAGDRMAVAALKAGVAADCADGRRFLRPVNGESRVANREMAGQGRWPPNAKAQGGEGAKDGWERPDNRAEYRVKICPRGYEIAEAGVDG